MNKDTLKDIILFLGSLALFALCGCAAKSHHIDLAGCYSAGGGIAIGSMEIQSAPEGVESSMLSYEDSKAWFSEQKEHRIRILLTGTNAVTSAKSIVKEICDAFVLSAASLQADGVATP
jgi:hypothetical protein